MLKVFVKEHGINAHLWWRGKIAELAFGFGSSVDALKTMGRIEMGLSEDETPTPADAWRRLIAIRSAPKSRLLQASRHKLLRRLGFHVCAGCRGVDGRNTMYKSLKRLDTGEGYRLLADAIILLMVKDYRDVLKKLRYDDDCHLLGEMDKLWILCIIQLWENQRR